MSKNPEDFSPEERAALDAWKAAEPPRDLAERVLARDGAGKTARWSEKKTRTIGAVLAIAASIAAAVWFVETAPVHGTHRAIQRSELALGTRAIAVSEANTELKWTIDRRGRAEVEQRSGNTFYRVEPGGLFVVHTPRGDVRVLGTCFRVEVLEMNIAAMTGLLGAGVGAALATTVVVSVYEGKVVTASPHGEVAIAAGESVRLDPGRGPVKIDKSAASALASSGVIEKMELKTNATPEELRAAHRALKVEAEKLRNELASLRAETEQAKRKEGVYNLDQDTLLHLAQKCELRWDMQSIGKEPQNVRTEDLEALHLSEDERAVIDRVYRENHAQHLKQITSLYLEITGDPSGEGLAPGSMFQEIIDKAPKGELQRVFQTLSRERAGLQPAPADMAATSPWERLFREMSGAGDGLEAAFAKELGADTARALRDLHQGWGSRTGLGFGCPGEK